MKAIRSSNKAFSLLELMIVITIIAILASASFPAYSLVTTRAKMMKSVSNYKQILTTLNLYALDWDGAFPNKDEDGNDFGNSTEVFQNLMLETGVGADEIFYYQTNNPQKSNPPNGDGFLDPVENCVVYVSGMNSSAPAGAPIIADEMENAGSYGQFHPWLEQRKAVVGYVGGQVRPERLTTNQPGATVRGPKGSNIDDIFQSGQKDDQGRVTGGLLPSYVDGNSILLPQ
jgi:prepilin-type N-terminal cleavage/methylation domain-containing protein